MLTIVSSVIVDDSRQADGRRWIRERHTPNIGETIDVVYMADAGWDVNAIMVARVASIESEMNVQITA